MKLDLYGKTINYQISGTGNPFLFVHGWGGNLYSLQALAQLFSTKYMTITIDLPGFGLSDKPDPEWGVGEYAKFLIDFIKKLNLKPVIYFGHSFGGALGIFITANYPNYINKLILSAASYKRNSPKTTKISRLFSRLPPQLKKISYKIFFPYSDLYKVPELEANFRKIVSQDLTSLLPAIKTSTLILWGKADRETPIEHAYELQKAIKNSQLKIFPEIGHNLPLQHPQLVYQEIKKFL